MLISMGMLVWTIKY